MLPKKKRVTKEIFQDIMKNGKMVSGPLFVLRYKASKSPQFAFIAPKTVAKQAVSRNKLRRQGYNSISKNPKIPNIIGLFFYKKEAKKASFIDIRDGVNTLLSKISL